MHFDRVFTVFLTMPVEMTSIMLLKTLYSLRAVVFFRGDYFLRSDQVHASSQATDGRSKKSTLDISLIAVPEWVNPILPTAPLKRHRPAFPSFE